MISVWQCKIGGPLETAKIPAHFDMVAREMLEALYLYWTGRAADFTISAWDGVLTDDERRIQRDRYPDTPEYQ